MKKAVLVCNGNINSKYLYANIKKGDYLIAVDGGANKLVKTIFTPDLIIGDMDSINKEGKKKFESFCAPSFIYILFFFIIQQNKKVKGSKICIKECYLLNSRSKKLDNGKSVR